MFFIVSKALAFLTQFSNLLWLAVAIGAGLSLTRFARAGRRLLAAALAAIALAGLSPAGSLLLNVLEDRFPPWDDARGEPTGFIILGGAIDPEIGSQRGAMALNGSAERIVVAGNLARKYPQARFVFSGGNASLFGGSAEAAHALEVFDALGVARARITLEARSRNTHENAVFCRDLLAPRPGERWVVITSAFHMPRAMGAFGAAGFAVEAYPVDWRTAGAGAHAVVRGDIVGGLVSVDVAVREFIGLAAYRLTGRSLQLFPAP